MVTVTVVRVTSTEIEADSWEVAQQKGMALLGDEDNAPVPDRMDTSINVERIT